jgi:hypothetical protein
MKRILVLLSLSSMLVAAKARAQEFYPDFALLIQLPSYETFLKNVGASPVTVDGYFITSQSDSLSPSGWASLDAANGPAIVSALGPGADQFDVLGAVDPGLLGELNLLGSATWQPGKSWSIGFPFDSDDPEFVFDPVFRFSSEGGLVLSGGTLVPGDGYALATILIVPEPSVAAMLAALAVAALVSTQRPGRVPCPRLGAGMGSRRLDVAAPCRQ